MRIATYRFNGERKVGLVSDNGTTITPFNMAGPDAARGALSIIETLAQGQPSPMAGGPAIVIADVQLEAPLPAARRNLWCVGRNYHAHAQELSGTVFKDNHADPASWPNVFTKVPECVTGPYDAVRIPAGISRSEEHTSELAVVIGREGKNIA